MKTIIAFGAWFVYAVGYPHRCHAFLLECHSLRIVKWYVSFCELVLEECVHSY